ncbi:MAG: helix-turn-helix domain-containing protein [Bryobacteraceae bacterium]|nr:helix-turn-helix domain-containing protein [Bryobacteraceae bacterium]
MRYREFAPSPALACVVERYWYFAGAAEGPQRVFPDGHAELVFHLGDGVRGQARTLLIGQMSRWVDIEPEGRLSVFGVRLQPAAAMRLAPVAGRIVDLADPWPRAAECRQQLGEAVDDLGRVAVAERWLSSVFGTWQPDRRIAAAVAVWQDRMTGVEPVAASVELSRRQLERLFRAQVGLEPKRFARIARFQRALRSSQNEAWASVAQEHGYYDQAHLIADFREFTGTAPTARPATEFGETLASRV